MIFHYIKKILNEKIGENNMGNKKIVFLTGASGHMGHEGFKQLLNRRDKFDIVTLVLPTERDKKHQ